MTLANEVMSFLNENTGWRDDFFHSEIDWGQSGNWLDLGGEFPAHNYRDGESDHLFMPDVETRQLDSYGGEDCGSTFYSVYEFKRGEETTIIRFNGWYQSFVGAEFEDMKEVQPRTKEVTEYV